MINDELTHWGVLGMKWGVRRYQNKDGSLTKAGKARLKSGNKKPKKLISPIKTKVKTEEELREEKKQEVLKSRSAKKLYDNADLFNDQELQRAYNRLQLERNIKSLAPKDVNKGKEFVDNAVKTGKTVAEVAETGTRLYNDFAKVYNSVLLGEGEKPLPIIKDNDKGNDKGKKKD